MASKQSDSLLPTSASLEKAISMESCVDSEAFSCNQVAYGTGDAVFSALIVAPLVVSVWRGTWGIMELNSPLFPYAQSFLLGIIIHVAFAVIKYHLLSRSVEANEPPSLASWLQERVISRMYTYVFIICNIMHWRGGWGLFDATVVAIVPDDANPHRPVVIAAFVLVFYVSNVFLRSSRNFLASPYFLVTDGKEPTYMFTTRFQVQTYYMTLELFCAMVNKSGVGTKLPTSYRPLADLTFYRNSRDTALYILDCVFSVGVVGSLVVFVWRGSWALFDIFLFPEDVVKSCWISLIGGYVLVVVTFGLQAPARWAASRLHGAPRLLLADVYHFISFVATVNVWRGVWGLLDVYLFPETPQLSNWCTHIVSLVLLMLLNCSNSVLVRGVYIDAEEPAGECVVIPCHYLRLYFHKERTKKRHKRALAAAAASRKSEDASLPLQTPEEKV